MSVMEKKRYSKPQSLAISVCTSLICDSPGNTYDPTTQTGLIQTNTTKVDASQAEVKQSGWTDWDSWD